MEEEKESGVCLTQELARLAAVRDALARQYAQQDVILKRNEELLCEIEKTTDEIRVLREKRVEKNLVLMRQPLLDKVSEPSLKSKLRWY